jgi:hypothetical protein
MHKNTVQKIKQYIGDNATLLEWEFVAYRRVRFYYIYNDSPSYVYDDIIDV